MKVPGWLLLALVAVVAGLYVRGNVFRGQAARNALRGDSLEAAADTTRRVFQNDHVRQERRIVQAELKRDSLDKQLKRTTALLASVTGQVRPLDTVLVAKVTEDSLIRKARFQADRPPYHVDLTAYLPPPPQNGSLEGSIRLDPAVLQMRTQCGQPVNGVRPATLMFSGPDWLEFSIHSAQQDPLFCNAFLKSKIHSPGYYVARVSLLTGALILIGSAVF